MDSGAQPPPRKGWHARGYLPHCDFPGLIQGITFRIHDSVPESVIACWKRELDWQEHRGNPGQDTGFKSQCRELHRRISAYEDAGRGSCYFNNPAMAVLMEQTLLFFRSERYHLFAWCVMPNHVHALIRPLERWSVGQIVHSWKRYTAREANRQLCRQGGVVWAPDYYDRFIRDELHFLRAVEYIHQNPVKAGLCASAGDWPWSSAHQRSADLQSAPEHRQSME